MSAVKPRLVNLTPGTRAAQPAASSVAAGAIYFVTDEGIIERSDGAAWAAYAQSVVLWIPATGNAGMLSGRGKDVTTGTRCFIVELGTAPTGCASDTAALFTRNDAAGIAQLCVMNEAGTITQLSGVRPVVLVKKSGTQSLSNGIAAAIAFDVEAFDVGGCHDNVTNNTRLTVPAGADGTYFITGNIEFASAPNGTRLARIRKNGTTTIATVAGPAVVGDVSVVQVFAITPLVAADYVELIGFQQSGDVLNVGDDDSSLSWTRL